MDELLNIGWWFSLFGQTFRWWFFCLLMAVAAWPLCLRVFRGLADRGAGLASGVGTILVMYIAWLFSLGWLTSGGEFAAFRLFLVAAGVALFGVANWVRMKGGLEGFLQTLAAFFPAGLLVAAGLIYLPHFFGTIWLALLMTAAGSFAAWGFDLGAMLRAMRRSAVPFAMAQLLFLIGFLFFTNVRSYIPYATFELSLYQAEKFGNLTHLNSIMESMALPPKDAWFMAEPTNYYYGGHLATATIAKATFYPGRIAFNLGLATIFANTLAMGFSFVYSLVHLTSRKVKLPGRIIWHNGMAWGLLGALAIAMFGNLDAWRQFFTRDPAGVLRAVEERTRADLEAEREQWKIDTGLPAVEAGRLLAQVRALGEFERPQTLAGELRRLAAKPGPVRLLREMAKEATADIEAAAGNPGVVASQLRTLVNSPRMESALEEQNVAPAEQIERRLLEAIREENFDAVPDQLNRLARKHRGMSEEMSNLADRIDEAMKSRLEAPEVKRLRENLDEEDFAEKFEEQTGRPASNLKVAIDAAFDRRDYVRLATAVDEFATAAETRIKQNQANIKEVNELFREAREALSFNAVRMVIEEWGGPPPPLNPAAVEGDLRWTPENLYQIDFWAPSRAIKGTPPGSREAGTITEFPYFSAILGDHHPHHSAIPFTLAALAACLALLRRASRLRGHDRRFLRNHWVQLLAMGFFIGAVFPVNIWDAVVLAPIYAVTVLAAWRGVYPSLGWRWVGFAGFVVLLSWVTGLLVNSMPGAQPVFAKTSFWGLAVVLMAAGIPLLKKLAPKSPLFLAYLVTLIVALVVIFAGALLSWGSFGEVETTRFGAAARDVLIFFVISTISALWALWNPQRVHLWWYSAGGVYAAVGALALFVILPFKLFFHSPLEPAGQILYEALPPILSHELITSNDFWRVLWTGSPVNPFSEALRTNLRDFFVHWGIFLIPILVLAVARLFTAFRGRERGFGFLMGMLIIGIYCFALNYMDKWTGPLSLAMMVASLGFGFVLTRRAEGPAWIFLSVAFFWFWFVEVLHFDDTYAGNLERYNTPFKIYYPLWAVMAGGMVVAVRELFARRRVVFQTASDTLRAVPTWGLLIGFGIVLPVVFKWLGADAILTPYLVIFWLVAIALIIPLVLAEMGRENAFCKLSTSAAGRLGANWQALVPALFLLAVGMYYPLAATANRTRQLFSEGVEGTWLANQPQRRIFEERTLDALAHLKEYTGTAQQRDKIFLEDYLGINWLEENLPRGTFILESPGFDAYSRFGRFAAGTGLSTILGWHHHQLQWRGWGKPAPTKFKIRYPGLLDKPQNLGPLFREVENNLEAPGGERQRELRLAGPQERLEMLREMYPEAPLMELFRLRRVIEKNDVTMMMVADKMIEDARKIYDSPEVTSEVKDLLIDYGIEYVIVGDLERKRFNTRGLQKFTEWKKVFDSSEVELGPDYPRHGDPVLIYKVPDAIFRTSRQGAIEEAADGE